MHHGAGPGNDGEFRDRAWDHCLRRSQCQGKHGGGRPPYQLCHAASAEGSEERKHGALKESIRFFF
jgi:hypothetical protein